MRLQCYTRDELLSLTDHRGWFNDALLDGFKLAETGSVYMIPSLEAAASLNIPMPPMQTLWGLIDCINITYLCGRLDSGSKIQEHCSCEAFAEDDRRCRHLWAVEFYVNRLRGAYHGPHIEKHPNFLAQKFPELRPFRRPAFLSPGVHGDQLVDQHGLCVFILLANSSVFLNKFEQYTTRREHAGKRIWSTLYHFFSDVQEGVEFLDWRKLFNELSSGYTGDEEDPLMAAIPELEFEMGFLDAANLLHTVLKIMDKHRLYGSSRFSALFEWKDDVRRTCGECFTEGVTDTIEGWKRFVVPARKMEGDMSPRRLVPTPTPSVYDLIERAQLQTTRFRCRQCRLVANQRIQYQPVKTPCLLLIDVKQHPRWAGASPWHIPTYIKDEGHEYELVGFLTHEVGRSTTRGFAAVTYHSGDFTEWLGDKNVKYAETPGRVPTIVLYQHRPRGQEKSDADHKFIPVNPVLPDTPESARSPTRTRANSLGPV